MSAQIELYQEAIATAELFMLDSEEIAIAGRKNTAENKLAFAVMLKFFQTEKRYPSRNDVIEQSMLNVLAVQLNCYGIKLDRYDWNSRTSERFRQEIRLLLGYAKATEADREKLINWLTVNVLPQAPTLPQITEQAYQFLSSQRLEPFKPAQLDRYIASSCYRFEQQFFADIFKQLSQITKESIDVILNDANELDDKEVAVTKDDTVDEQDAEIKRLAQIKLKHLKKDIAGARLKNIGAEIDKLMLLRALNLPDSLVSVSRKLKQKYYTRIFAELPSGIKEHRPQTLYASMAIFCHFRSEVLTDNLVNAFMQLIHKIRTSAEISVNKDILSEVRCVNGKFDILYTLAGTAVENPSGTIKDTIYPKVSKEKLSDLVKELMSNKGTWYQYQVQRKMRSTYSHAHRRVFIMLLEIFVFRTNNQDCFDILRAIEFIKANKNISDKYYPDTCIVPATTLIASKWRSQVIEEQDSTSDTLNETAGKTKNVKINRINYEVAILEELHKLLDCKQIWVKGAYRYRNPEEDLPKDFDSNAEYYYKKLALPIDGNDYVQTLQASLDHNLQQLNNSITDNNKVKIVQTKKNNVGTIKLTPYDAQIEPSNLIALQQAIHRRWSTINLIDILKETNLRIGFSKHFHTVATRENISEDKLLKRLLLSLYAIGSNTGLKRISAANDDTNYSDLRYIKRRFINVANTRQAITEIVNAILEVRNPSIWGSATTGCVCDSTKVSSWDQNLMTEWHTRYHGRGVMIYWHVDKNAACIYSQLKTCSSSEVGSMIKGVLDHCTKMDVKQSYVDTHGQSTIGFAFSHLLHFDLLPRLKNIKKQKLYYSTAKDKGNYKNLSSILKSSINWDLIKKYGSVASVAGNL
jgi:hypothetical protein